MKTKKFKTVLEQKEYLVNNKNIISSDLINKALSERSYSSIINPYKRLFAKGKTDKGHVYPKDIEFKRYLEVAAMDDFFSAEIFKWLGVFERKLKNKIAYLISKHLFENGDDESISYVEELKQFFETKENVHLLNIGMDPLENMYTNSGKISTPEHLLRQRKDLLRVNILNIGNKTIRSKNNLIKHYQLRHNKVPFWLLVHDLTLGNLQMLNGMLSKPLKEQLYREFYVTERRVSYRQLIRFSGILETLRAIRNVVSHNESLISYVQDYSDSKTGHFFVVIKLLKDTYNESVIANQSAIDLNMVVINEFNKNNYNTINMLYDFVK